MRSHKTYRHAVAKLRGSSGSMVSLKKTLKQVQGDVESGFTLANSLLISRIGRHAEFSSASIVSLKKTMKQVQGDVHKFKGRIQ